MLHSRAPTEWHALFRDVGCTRDPLMKHENCSLMGNKGSPGVHADIARGKVQDEVGHIHPVGQVVAHLLKVIVRQLCAPIVQRMPLCTALCFWISAQLK